MNEKLITIAEFPTGFEAGLAKVVLESNGIKSMVVGEDLIATMPPIPSVSAQLQVLEHDAEQAKTILDEHAKEQSQ